MPLQGYSATGGKNDKQLEQLEQPPDFKQLVTDEHRLAERLAPPGRLFRWRSSNAPQVGTVAGSLKSGTAFQVNTNQDSINALTVTVSSGTLWVFLSATDPSGNEVPDLTFGALTPVNPVEVSIPLDRYMLTLYAKSADCVFSVLGKAA